MDALASLMVNKQFELEAEYAPRVSAALTIAMDSYTEALRISGQSAGGLSAIAKQQLVATLTDLHRDTIEQYAAIILRAFEEGFKALELKTEDEVRRIVGRYIDRYGAGQAAQIIQTTERQVSDLILGGLRRGEAVNTVFGNFINKIPEIADQRARIITQTEAHAAGQFASQQIAERSNVPLRKRWTSIRDERTRGGPGRLDDFNHWIMNDTAVAVSQSFAVPTLLGGMEMLQFPGDPAGSAGNIINCRCVQTYERADQ